MNSTLLIIGGVIQILILALHAGIFFGIASSGALGANDKISAHIFNAAVTTSVLFFAYVSFFQKRELMNSNLGRIICGFIALFYIQRGLVEVFLRGIDPVNLGLSLVIASLYIVVMLPSKSKTANQ